MASGRCAVIMVILALYPNKLKLNFSPDTYHIRNKVKEYLSFVHKNRYYVQSYKDGTWDGTISFLDKYNQTMTGFAGPIISFFEELGVPYEVTDLRENAFDIDVSRIIDKVPEDRQYQLDIVKQIQDNNLAGIPFYNGIIKAATNSGKSYVMSYLIQASSAKKILFLVSSKVVPKQMFELFSQHDEVGTFDEDKRITISTPKKLYNALQKSKQMQVDMKKYDLLLVDECHKAASPTFLGIFKHMVPYASLFFSATALDMENVESRLKITGLSGNTLAIVHNKDVVDKGLSLALTVRFLPVAGVTCNSYTTAYHFNIIANESMHELIYKECVNSPKITLVVVQFLEHAQNIQEYFKNKGFFIPILSGEEYDDNLYQGFKSGEYQWLITTMVIKEGANLPKVSKQIMAFGGKSKITVTQIVGRGQRVDAESDNRDLEIIDFKFSVKYLQGHYAKRKAVYKELGATIVN